MYSINTPFNMELKDVVNSAYNEIKEVFPGKISDTSKLKYVFNNINNANLSLFDIESILGKEKTGELVGKLVPFSNISLDLKQEAFRIGEILLNNKNINTNTKKSFIYFSISSFVYLSNKGYFNLKDEARQMFQLVRDYMCKTNDREIRQYLRGSLSYFSSKNYRVIEELQGLSHFTENIPSMQNPIISSNLEKIFNYEIEYFESSIQSMSKKLLELKKKNPSNWNQINNKSSNEEYFILTNKKKVDGYLVKLQSSMICPDINLLSTTREVSSYYMNKLKIFHEILNTEVHLCSYLNDIKDEMDRMKTLVDKLLEEAPLANKVYLLRSISDLRIIFEQNIFRLKRKEKLYSRYLQYRHILLHLENKKINQG